MTLTQRLTQVLMKHQLVLMIVATIAVALIMTWISLSLYVSGGTLQLDLSRPGYEAVRKEIFNPNASQDFSATGSVDSAILDKYQTLFDAQRQDLNSFSRFKDKALDDDSLTLGS